MKRLTILMVCAFLLSVVSCRPDSVADQTNTNEQATGKDCVPVAGEKECDEDE